jgi:MFS family permease
MPQSTSSVEVTNGFLSSPDIEGNAANERTPLIKHNGNGHRIQSDRVPPVHETNSDPHEGETTVTPKELPFHKLAIIFSTAWVGVFLGAIDSSVIATLTVPISSEFQSLTLLSWLATAYLISNAVFQPLSGRLTDIFGRGPGLVFSHIVFSAGNLICGLATSGPQLILGRVIAGIGGGGLMSIATFLGSDLVPLRKRGVVQGILTICFGSGAMLGGVFGGLLNDYSNRGWRLAFLVQAPPSLLAAAGVYFLVRIPPKQSQKSYLARIDFLGVFLMASFLVLFLVGLNTGGNIVPWTHAVPLTTIPLSVIAFFGLLFYIPLYLQVRGRTATEVGLLILFSPLGTSCSSVGAGIIMNKTGKYIGLGVASVIVMIFGVIIFGFHDENTHDWLTAIVFFLIGSGYAAMLTTTLLACIAAVKHANQAVVTSATC